MSLTGINSSCDHILLLVNAQDSTFVKRWKVANMVNSCVIYISKTKPCHSHISLRVHTRQQSMEFPATAILHQKRLWSFRQYQQHHGSIPCIWKGPYIDAECIRHPELLLPRQHAKCCLKDFKRWFQKRKHHDTIVFRSLMWCWDVYVLLSINWWILL